MRRRRRPPMLRRSVVPAGTLPRRNPPPFPHLKSIPKIFKSNPRYPYTTLLLLFPKTSLDSKNEESFWEGLRSQFHPKPLFYRQAKGVFWGRGVKIGRETSCTARLLCPVLISRQMALQLISSFDSVLLLSKVLGLCVRCHLYLMF